MSAQPNSLLSANIASHNNPELNHRIDVLVTLASCLMAEAERLRSIIECSSEIRAIDNSSTEFRQRSVVDGCIDFYGEIEHYEVELITKALSQARGSQRRAAKLLGLNATTLNAKIKHLGIGLNSFPRIS